MLATITDMLETLAGRVKRLRKEMDWNQSELARNAGVKPQNIQQLEKGDVKNPRYLDKLAVALGVTPDFLLTGTPSSQPRSFNNRKNRLSLADEYIPASRDLPVMGQAMGGPDGEFVLNGEVADYVYRPQGLEGAQSAYAVRVCGVSMEPRYMEGETVYLHPGRPIVPNCFVLVQIAAEGDEQPNAFIKQFAKRDGERVHLKQFNPSKKIVYLASQVVSIHRIVGAGDF